MKTAKNILIFWVIIAFLVTFTSLLVYVATQQVLRLGANGIPAELAVKTSINLENSKSPLDAVPGEITDISKSLGTFVMVFDKDKNLIASSAAMGKGEPSYPKGVLDYVDKKGEDRVTWQPEKGLRFATIAIKSGDKYIVAGRSLKETERLIDTIGNQVFLAWLACMIFSSISLGIIYIFIKKVFKSQAAGGMYAEGPKVKVIVK
jgi:hypothetical protein